MICDVKLMLFNLDLLNPIMVMRWNALCCVWFIDWHFFLVSLCGAKMYVYETLDLTIFESLISCTCITF